MVFKKKDSQKHKMPQNFSYKAQKSRNQKTLKPQQKYNIDISLGARRSRSKTTSEHPNI